jgi:hypothetical protein
MTLLWMVHDGWLYAARVEGGVKIATGKFRNWSELALAWR